MYLLHMILNTLQVTKLKDYLSFISKEHIVKTKNQMKNIYPYDKSTYM